MSNFTYASLLASLIVLFTTVVARAQFEEERSRPAQARIVRPTVVCAESDEKLNAKLKTLVDGTYQVSAPSVSVAVSVSSGRNDQNRSSVCVLVTPEK